MTISANLGEGKKQVSFDFFYPTNDNNLNVIVRNALKMLAYTFFFFSPHTFPEIRNQLISPPQKVTRLVQAT